DPKPDPKPDPGLPSVTGVTYTTSLENYLMTGVAQVATLPIMNDAASAGMLQATFTDGTSPVAVNVVLNGTETATHIATEIAAAFGSAIKGWNVTASGANVIFTADAPAANNASVTANVEGIETGIGMLTSKITTPGVESISGTAQVATLSISNGAKAQGSLYAEFTDGTQPVRIQIYLKGFETADEVAANIAGAFGNSIPGWNVSVNGSDVLFIAQVPAANNDNVVVHIFEASGTGAPTSTITIPGDVHVKLAQVVTLQLRKFLSSGGPIGVTFTDGISTKTVYLTMLGDPETGDELASKIAAAFGNSIPGWNVTTDHTRVLFKAYAPAENNPKAFARLSGLDSGVGMPDSTITTLGNPAASAGAAQVATIAIPNGATAPGSIHAEFTDGLNPVAVNVPVAGTETADELAMKIATAFGSSVIGWDVAAIGSNVQFTALAPAANNDLVVAKVEEMPTGMGQMNSTITSEGVAASVGGTKTATLTITEGAKKAGTLLITFTNGTASVPVHVTLTGTETPAEVATKIAQAFGNSVSGWDVAANDKNVHFTANIPTAIDTNVSITIQE
ncbi:hypothetical protein, partial [Paenibacillus sp. KS1]|uniref:hypothetical protein n=1 Tax=Paenibacillus sp. KS1 TaxID=1849249 RepID=UPI000AC21DA7